MSSSPLTPDPALRSLIAKWDEIGRRVGLPEDEARALRNIAVRDSLNLHEDEDINIKALAYDRMHLLDVIVKLADRLSTPVSPSGTWRAVTETDPPQGKYVLILIKGRAEAWIARRYNQWERPGEPWLDADRVEAWQPLPSRPLPECSTPVSPPDGDLLGLCEEVLRLDGQATPDWHQGDTEEHEAGDADMVYTAEGDRLAGPFRREADARLIATYRSAAPRLARALRDRLMAPAPDKKTPAPSGAAGSKARSSEAGVSTRLATQDHPSTCAAPEQILQGEPRPPALVEHLALYFRLRALCEMDLDDSAEAEAIRDQMDDTHRRLTGGEHRAFRAAMAALYGQGDPAEAAQGEGAPPAVDLWVEARRLITELCVYVADLDGSAIWDLADDARNAIDAHDPAAAERLLLIAQDTAGFACLLVNDSGIGCTHLGHALAAALTAVRALPKEDGR